MNPLTMPLIVVGAGRSGTTMIREALMHHPHVAGFEFEMNMMWRYGNALLDHDMLDPDRHLSPRKQTYIRAAFARELADQGRQRILDKTVANVMRLRYVQAVLPECRILHVVRDGRAVTASAMKRWRATSSAGYAWTKSRTVPQRDLPVYAARAGVRALKRRVLRKEYSQSWGPRWPGFDDDVRELSLARVCARQWRLSVEAALRESRALPTDAYLEVQYERLVSDPEDQFDRIRSFFELPEDGAFRAWTATEIHAGSLDKWKGSVQGPDLTEVMDEIGALMERLGYP